MLWFWTAAFVIAYLLLAQMLVVKTAAYKGQKTATLDVFSVSFSYTKTLPHTILKSENLLSFWFSFKLFLSGQITHLLLSNHDVQFIYLAPLNLPFPSTISEIPSCFTFFSFKNLNFSEILKAHNHGFQKEKITQSLKKLEKGESCARSPRLEMVAPSIPSPLSILEVPKT